MPKISEAVMGQLEEALGTMNVGMALIQEPYTRHGKVSGFSKNVKNSRVYLKSVGHTCCNCLYITKHHSNFIASIHRPISSSVRGESTWRGTLCAVSAYIPPGHEFSEFLVHLSKLENTFDHLRGSAVVLGADLNAKSFEWFSGEVYKRGERFEELIARNNLYVINTESMHTTFWTPNRGESNIDATITNSKTLTSSVSGE